MRFHIGISKRIPIKWILIPLGLVLAFFGLVPHAYADSFTLAQSYSWCTDFSANDYENSSCFRSNTFTTNTINGVSGVLKPPTSYIQSIGKTGAEKHSEFFKFGGTTGCATGSTVSFDVDVFFDDVQEVFQNNVLDFDAWSGVLTRGANLRGMNYFGYYSWLSNIASDTENKLGVYVGKTYDYGNRNLCTFVSYGSNKSLKFRCSVASHGGGYQISIKEYNENGSFPIRSYASDTSLPAIVTGIKINMLYDPCKPYSTDQSGVVNAITDQTNDIMEGLQDIIDNNNANTNSINSHIDGVAEGIEGLSDSIDDVADGIDGIKDSMNNSNTNAYVNGLGITFADHGVSSILQAPLRLYSGVLDSAYAWNGTSNSNGVGYTYSCNDLPINFSLFGRSVSASLPCGKVLWNSADSSFKTIWFLGVCGVFSWVALMKLVRLVEDSLNPDKAEELSDDLSRL